MTTPRKIVAAVALATVSLLATVGVAVADPDEVNDGGNNGGHTNSSVDRYGLGDDNGCNYKYKRDGSKSKKFDGDDDDCPTIYPVTNPPNPAVRGQTEGTETAELPKPPAFPSLPALPFP